MELRRFCLILITLGILVKFYGINDPWKRSDHYNYGGVLTTTYAECLKTTPLAVSKAVPHIDCWKSEPAYYRNHPPTILFGMWAWTSVFGSEEWAYRSFILLFSVLNIGLIFLIAKEVRPGNFPYLAAACQACFLGNMYFGTHPDFIGEFTVTFLLLGALFALRKQMWAACVLGLVAGISAWPGYIFFGPLFIYSLMIKEGRKRVVAFGAFGVLLAIGTMMWLQQKSDVIEFLMFKIFTPGYLKPERKGWIEIPQLFKSFFDSQARLMSPLLAGIALYGLFVGLGRSYFKRVNFHTLSKLHHAVLLSGGTGLLYFILSREYFVIHIFLYLLFTPALALLAANFLEQWSEGKLMAPTKSLKRGAIFFVFLSAAVYPFGIYKSNVTLDIVAAIFLTVPALMFLYLAAKNNLAPKFMKIA
ncbi:MAG: hypothetical protein EOP06_21170, partial [Proteobacteria bacterium]